MPIPTSRTKENGRITIDAEKCNGCGLCVEVCSDKSLAMKDGKAVVTDETSTFGCIACGHCMAICPTGAISVEGRFMSPADVFDLPKKEEAASYDSLLHLLQRRRSTREFKDNPVEQELIDKVLAAAMTAPMGIPPSDVNVMVLDSKEKVFRFAKDYCQYLESLKWMVSPAGLLMIKLFWSKQDYEMFRDFIKPLIRVYIDSMKQDKDIVLYGAPMAFYFYGSPYTDPADPIITATYAMTAAESLGLGTCMLGAIHPFIQQGKAAEKFRKKWGIRWKSKEGLFLIMGYPKVRYHKGIRRTFANVDILN